MVAGKKGQSEVAKTAVIYSQVHIGKPSGHAGFGLEVELKVEGVEDQSLIDAAHEVRITLLFPCLSRLAYSDVDHDDVIGMPIQSRFDTWRCCESLKSVRTIVGLRMPIRKIKW